MPLLAIETSSSLGSLALLESSTKVLSQREWTRQKSHSEVITAHLHSILEEQQLSAKELSSVAVSLGPGSFTGLRVGVNLARSLSFALNLPIVAIPSLQVLAHPVALNQDLPVLALVNAFKNRLFVAAYLPTGEEFISPTVMTLPQLEKSVANEFLVVGDAYSIYSEFFSPKLRQFLHRDPGYCDYPMARGLGELAFQDPHRSQTFGWRELKPLYIRESAAEEKLNSSD